MSQTVYVMMSGGVDSSVAAAQMVAAGYTVVGVFMKCWSIEQLESLGVDKSLYGCFWEEDSTDARLVADKLNIPFYVWDFQAEYKQKVVDYMIAEYRQGRTPNPDVMCNSVVKFGVFYERARALGADFVATGHYARIIKDERGTNLIGRAFDENKDQSYFLWRIGQEQIQHTLFPIGEFATKAQVRALAEELDLITAKKPDSQGLCFVGTTPLREMLLQTLGQQEGAIVTKDGKKLGTHPGAYLYTIGQREKLGLSGGPWYVSQIRIDTNEVVVSHGNEAQALQRGRLQAIFPNWQVDIQNFMQENKLRCEAQIRYRQPAEACTVTFDPVGILLVEFEQPVRAIAPGQSIVFYIGEKMLGGATILE